MNTNNLFKLIKELFNQLSPDQRKRFFSLQILVILMAVLEVIGIASIGPFMAMVSDPSVIHTNPLFNPLYKWTGLDNHSDFLFFSGLLVLTFLTIAALVSMFTIWRLSLFAAKVGTQIADRLYNYYMQQNWLFHASSSSAQLTKQIATEAMRVTDQVIQPLMHMTARIVLASLIAIAMILYNPVVAFTGLFIFSVAYIILFKVIRKRLQKNGEIMSSVMTQRFRLMSEGFGGIKDVILLGRKQNFLNQFERSGHMFAYARGTNVAISNVPRHLMELIAFGSIIALVLFLLASESHDIAILLPVLSVYGLAGLKLLPALQQIYANLSQVKGNIAAFEVIREDLVASQKQNNSLSSEQSASQPKRQHLRLTQHIALENVTFAYPGKAPVLKELNLTIPAQKVVGIVGPSGSGKSSTIDLLLGLIEPQQGQLSVDGTPISEHNKRALQNMIGFVPQSIFLSEGSIAENVAFGIPPKDINLEQVNKALSLAHLDELVKSLDQGIHTKVGERGVQLSGGQRQRVGIARALYHDADVLVFDEATSALDGITEKMIMDAIHDFSGQKTIIMIAHRLKTVQECDTIFIIDQGRVVAQGAYEELLKTNEHFKKMASHA